MESSTDSNPSAGQQKKIALVPLLAVIGLVMLISIPFAVQATTTPRIAAGVDHALALKSDGTVWAWGSNMTGQLGTGGATGSSSDDETAPTFGTLSSATAVAAGETHSMALKKDSTMVAWGNYSGGLLGNPNASGISTAVPVLNSSGASLSNATAIATGYDHSVALVGGAVYTWGDNYYGQLGLGNNATDVGTHTAHVTPTAVTITGTPTITAIAAGSDFTLALDSSGNVWAWGDNSYGQLGNGSTSTNNPTPGQVTNLSGIKVIAIAAGWAHALAVDNSGAVWAWGLNYSGQLGNSTNMNSYSGNPVPVKMAGLSGASAVSAGYIHSMALDGSGNVWAWGGNTSGQLGQDPMTPLISTDTPQKISALSGVSAISAGEFFSMALTSSGSVFTWGDNRSGQLGYTSGLGAYQFTPTAIMNFNAGSTGSCNILGDMDCDGSVTPHDALLALQYSVDINPLGLTLAQALARGAMTPGETGLTPHDALLILKKSVGL